ncbi:MAG: imidazoleglycerol-phosphate dehydratase HisB [Spirochaetales bacterium]|nr:imidazoleglycerol-phosphate dehydratase HisB [Spirochaetales bacterium]
MSKRTTKETDIHIEIDPDAGGNISIATGLPFMDHLLHAMAFHGGFGFIVKAKGDIDVDPHHLVEDTGIVLGEALKSIVSNHGVITRFSHAIIPMDDALSEVVIDVCGRPTLAYTADFPQDRVGDFDVSLLREFLAGLSARAGMSLHAHIRYGENSHHMAESLFKALGKAIKAAYAKPVENNGEMSTKGTI